MGAVIVIRVDVVYLANIIVDLELDGATSGTGILCHLTSLAEFNQLHIKDVGQLTPTGCYARSVGQARLAAVYHSDPINGSAGCNEIRHTRHRR